MSLTLRFQSLLLALTALTISIGCADETGEAALAAANEERAKAASRVASAEEHVDARKRDVEVAEAHLEKAEKDLAEARKRLRNAETIVGRAATDDVLFRAVQKRLLEDEDLGDVAVAAEIKDSVAILKGSVPNRDLREHAGRIAAATPGVLQVRNQIEIAVSSGPPSR